MCSRNVILTTVTICCVVLLCFASYHTIVHGPRNTPLSLRINSCDIDTTEQKNNITFPLKWNAEFVLVNTKAYLEEIIIFSVEAYISYKGFPFSCGLTPLEEIQTIPEGAEKSFEVKYVPGKCELKSDFNDSPVYKSFDDVMKEGTINVTVTLNIHAYYKCNKFWGWDVWITPLCKNLIIEYDDKIGYLEDDQPVSCEIPRPKKYI